MNLDFSDEPENVHQGTIGHADSYATNDVFCTYVVLKL